jgi:hypothetical protein
MAAIQTLENKRQHGNRSDSSLADEIDRLTEENESLNEDNKQLRAAASIYRQTVHVLMRRCDMPIPD